MNTKVAIAALLIALLAGTRASAQVGENTGETQQLQRRCSTVAVMSEVPGLPAHDLYTSLKRRPDFQISKLVPVGDPELADATIHLGVGTDGGTQIVVTNRWTKERAGSNSNWSRYPGMIAMDAMSSLEMVCPGSVRKVPSNSSASAACALQPAVHPVTFHTISACSHTSWIGNRELYAALQADSQLKAMGVELLPACTTTADVQLQVTHNLEQTEDWTWQLNAADGHSLTTGRLVAFQGKEVAGKLARAALHQLAVTNGSEALAENQRSSQPLPAGKTVHAKWLPTDLANHDTHVTLYFDTERVWARDRSGASVFEFSAQQFRDARLAREWWQPLVLDDPTGLIDAIATPADADGVMIYLGIGAVLAQVRIPRHSLELAWEKDGIIKTVALEVSKRDGKQLIHDLNNAASAQETACDRDVATIRAPQYASEK